MIGSVQQDGLRLRLERYAWKWVMLFIQINGKVKWGMDLVTFTAPKIKQILNPVLVKRMGTDVREGRRRQFNYIGRLLREVEPDLRDALIQSMKKGDHIKLQTISNTDWIMENDDEELDDAESEAESMEVLEVDKRSLMLSSSSTVAVAVNGSRKSKYTLKWALERFVSEVAISNEVSKSQISMLVIGASSGGSFTRLGLDEERVSQERNSAIYHRLLLLCVDGLGVP
ncbi:hypothetical protein Syun_006880 [Stephania yunnanensis]|uniref:Uncharacterized protein n=1 Tax=Stephania yunnanensis TaxID=152371 RepID=A0AAP0PZR6_9MAGN